MDLANFTDILGDTDEIGNSQPLSLSLTPESNSATRMPLFHGTIDTYTRNERPARGTGQQGEFRSVEEIDPKYRDVFSYPYFNLVQSRVIDDALYSDKSMVVCAPTGSGKTVVFEMAIVQLLMELDNMRYTGDFKIIYMAPVKALCTERLSEWYPKFTKLGLMCIEVTGDTNVDFSQLKPYRIIITTPEKWDMLTRRWRDHKSLVEVIKLFLIDEVHILNDASRGPVLEAVVSRMKTIESSCRSAHRIEQLQKQYQTDLDTEDTHMSENNSLPVRIRFVAVSATVSNPEDVAEWLGTNDKPAVYYKFGDECRPVKLKRVVEGYPCSEGTSIFKFDIILNYKLWPVIQKYHDGKPTLIFCNTRKSVTLTAETLSRELTVSFTPEQQARLSAVAANIKNKKLQALILSGVGCHHAGLLYEERIHIEEAFRNRDLPILITTTTLAMGVNLPAHLVIIKNTQQYVNGAYQEYSISTVLQMVGRAGRPQFDTDATAVIMTRLQDKARYQALVGGDEPLQSYLHKRLPENLNSEAALGTVCDVAQCVQWLGSTFLSVRAAKDPKRYLGLPQNAQPALISKKIEELCVKAMNGLASSGLITMDEASCIESTEAGRLMSIFYLDLETMKHIMKIEGTETLDKLLCIVCESHELADMHLRVDERRILNTLNRNNAAATIRFPMKGKINTRQMKLNCIIQAVLGCLPIPDPSLNQEAMKVMRIADRVCKCLVAYVTRPDVITTQPQYFTAVVNALTLAKCVDAHLWENSPYVSKQLKGIGPTFSTLLASAGKVNFTLLEESHPRDLERIMNKSAPAGNVLRKQVSMLPKYQLTATPIDEKRISIKLVLLNQHQLAENREHLTAGDSHKCYVVVGDSENYLLLFTSFKDKDLMSVYDGAITYEVTRKHDFEHKIQIHCISSNWVGIDVQCDYFFKNIVPPFIRGEAFNLRAQDTPKKTTKRQTSITDVYKERKRKNNEIDITESKEKKKRDTALVEKFKLLKNSFEVTSKELREDLDKSTHMSNMIIKQMIQPDKYQENTGSSSKSSETIFENTDNEVLNLTARNYIDNPASKSRPDTNRVNNENQLPRIDRALNDEDNFDVDDRIKSILNDIETEIFKTNKNDSRNYSKPNLTTKENIIKETANISAKLILENINDNTKSITYGANNNFSGLGTCSTINKSANEKRKRKPLSEKTNYSFLDTIEKNVTFDQDVNVPQKDSGFSDTIKSQIEKFLKNTVTTKQDDITLKGLLRNMEQDERTATPSETILDGCSESDRKVSLSSKSPAISIYIDDDINKPIPNKRDIPKQNKLDITNDTQFDNFISNNMQNIDEIVENIEHEYNTSAKGNKQMKESDNKLIKNKSTVTPVKRSHNEDITYEENDKYSDISVKEAAEGNILKEKPLLILTNKSLVPAKNMSKVSENTVEFDKYIEDDLYGLVRPKCLPFLDRDSTKLYLNKDYCSKFYTTAGDGKSQTIVQGHPSPSKEVIPVCETKHDKSLTDKFISNITENSEDNNSKFQVKSNIVKYMSSAESSTEKNNPNVYVNKYSFSATKTDVCTKNLPDHRIQIIRKVKLDLDVTEIVSKENNESTNKMKTPAPGVEKYQTNNEIIKNRNLEEYYEASISSLQDLQTLDMNKKVTVRSIDKEINYSPRNEVYISNITHSPQANPETRKIKDVFVLNEDKNTEDVKNVTVNHVDRLSPTKPQTYAHPMKAQNLNVIKEYEERSAQIDSNSNRDGKCLKLLQTINSSTTVSKLGKREAVKDNMEEYKKYLFEIANGVNTEGKFSEPKQICTIDEKKLNLEQENIHTHTERVQQSNESKSNSIENILQKYSEILRKNDTISNLNPDKNKNDAPGQSLEKTKKVYKISDIHNVKIPLPKNLISVEASRTSRPSNDDILVRIKDMEQCNEIKTPEKVVNTEDIKENISNEVVECFEDNFPEDVPECYSPDISNPQEELVINYDLDQSMLNPKTLLQQCFHKDEIFNDEIIPPPSEFCDYENVYSPIKYEVVPTSQEYFESERNFSLKHDLDKSIFEEDNHSVLTPSVEIETWNLSRENEEDDPVDHFSRQIHSQYNPNTTCGNEAGTDHLKSQACSQFNINKSCTVMRRNPYCIRDTLPSQNSERNSRQRKLGNFKFTHKKKLRM